MKKILYVHHAGELGGAPKSLALLISNLNKDKYKPIVLMIKDGPARNLFIKAGAEVIVDSRLGAFHGTTVSGMSLRLFLNNIVYLPTTWYFGKKIIKKVKPDLVHLNTTCLFQYAKISKKLNNNVPVVTHVREPLLNSIFGKILKIMNYRYVDSYIAIEEYDLSKMKTKNKLTKVIYNAVDFNKYNSKIKSDVLMQDIKASNNDVIFLYLARVVKSNGLLKMIKDINALNLNEKFKFAIVGLNYEKENYYEKQIINEAKKNSNIHLFKFRSDIPKVIASSDVVIVPFIEPHFSRAVIEAAAIGIPSVVSNVKGLDELVVDDETGYIYDLDNKNKLLEILNKIGDNHELRSRLGERAESRARKEFDAEINARRTEEVYEKLLES